MLAYFVMPLSLEVDLHCHLLPAWDDGPPDVAGSLRLAARLAGGGVRTAFATPHVGRQEVVGPGHEARHIEQAVQELQSRLREANIALDLVAGAEVLLAPGLPERLRAEPWLCLGSCVPSPARRCVLSPARRCVLVELGPHAPWTPEVDAMLFQIALAAVTPILAHPERYPDIQRDLSIARALVGRGVLLQISAASLLARRGAAGATARALLREGLAALVASDAHCAEGVVLEQACAQVEALLGEQGARQVLVENPRRLARGEEVSILPRPRASPASLLSRWLKRG